MQFYLSKNTTNCLKVLSAVMVMLHHYSQYVCANDISDALFFRILSSQGGFLGVAVFFFLSGYGLMESESKNHLNAMSFFKRRLLKIYLPVLSISFIWMIVSPLLLNQSPFGSGVELTMGGNTLVISNILWAFGDNVLWFIKILIPLYAIFFLFSIVYQRNRGIAISFLWIMTIAFTIYVALTKAAYESISIVYFTLGVQMSISKIKSRKDLSLYISLISFIGVLNYISFDWTIAQHAIINAVCLGFLTCALCLKRIDIKFPTILALLSFDLYLTHNKVLMGLKDNTDSVELWAFVTLTIMATLAFYFFRTKLLRIQ